MLLWEKAFRNHWGICGPVADRRVWGGGMRGPINDRGEEESAVPPFFVFGCAAFSILVP